MKALWLSEIPIDRPELVRPHDRAPWRLVLDFKESADLVTMEGKLHERTVDMRVCNPVNCQSLETSLIELHDGHTLSMVGSEAEGKLG